MPLQRVTGQQQGSNLVVGDLWPFLEEVPDRIEGFRHGQNDELVNQRLEPLRGVVGRDRHREDDPRRPSATNGLDTSLRGIAGRHPIVREEDGAIG